MKVLVVSSYSEIKSMIADYVQQSQIPSNIEFTYFIEYWRVDLPENLAPGEITCRDFGDAEELARAMNALKGKTFDAVITDDEYSIYIAARIRESLGLPGVHGAHAIRLRDKLQMKRALDSTQVRTPRVLSIEHLKRGDYPLPLIAKPRAFGGSNGVRILKTHEDVQEFIEKWGSHMRPVDSPYRELDADDLQVEEFITGKVMHLDGISESRKCSFLSIGEYVGNCVDFEKNGQPLGSFMPPSEEARRFWMPFVHGVLEGLEFPDGAFHLEVFQTHEGEQIFMEIAARPGGALIIPAIREAYGVDLRIAHLRLQLGLGFTPPARQLGSAGWIIFPKRFHSKDSEKVVAAKLENEQALSSLVEKKIPTVGTDARGSFSYMHNNGQFLFFSQDWARIGTDIGLTRKNYHLEVRALDRPISDKTLDFLETS